MSPRLADKNTKMYLHRIFYCRCTNNKNEPLAMLRKNELNICSYKYKNRLTTTRTKEEILICSLWHLLEVVFRSSEVVQIEHCRATRSPLGNKLKDAVVLQVCSNDKSVSFSSNSYPELFQNRPNKLHFPKNVHLEHCPGKYCTSRHQTSLCYSLGCSKERSIALWANGLHELFKKRPEKLWLRNFVQIALTTQILRQ